MNLSAPSNAGQLIQVTTAFERPAQEWAGYFFESSRVRVARAAGPAYPATYRGEAHKKPASPTDTRATLALNRGARLHAVLRATKPTAAGVRGEGRPADEVRGQPVQ